MPVDASAGVAAPATDAAIARLDAVTLDEVRQVAAGITEQLAVACVGPHTVEDFESV